MIYCLNYKRSVCHHRYCIPLELGILFKIPDEKVEVAQRMCMVWDLDFHTLHMEFHKQLLLKQ